MSIELSIYTAYWFLEVDPVIVLVAIAAVVGCYVVSAWFKGKGGIA